MELGKSGGELRVTMSRQDRFLSWMYGHRIGRILIYPLINPVFSKIGGAVLSSRFSALFVKSFARRNGIDLMECEKQRFRSFNDFFTRKLKIGTRPFVRNPEVFIAPCDGRLSVYEIREDSRFRIKFTPYKLEELVKDRYIADKYAGGTLWLFRLCVDDYHRYIYPVSGEKTTNRVIPGVFHTVNPVANDVFPIYKENTREFCRIRTEEFGTVLMMEVGAMLVGKIENRTTDVATVKRGQEKGNFAFGGSTIILLTKKGCVDVDAKFLENTARGIETKVRMGQAVGRRAAEAPEPEGEEEDDI